MMDAETEKLVNNIPQDDGRWYIEARVSGNNYRGDSVRFIWDRRGSGEKRSYVNEKAEEVFESVNAALRATTAKLATLEAENVAIKFAAEELLYAIHHWRSGGMSREGCRQVEERLSAILHPSPKAGAEVPPSATDTFETCAKIAEDFADLAIGNYTTMDQISAAAMASRNAARRIAENIRARALDDGGEKAGGKS